MGKLATRAAVDTAGGLITGGVQSLVSIASGGQSGLWSVQGDAVASHGSGGHAAATLTASQALVTIAQGGSSFVPVVQGDPATCGHTASGSGHVDVTEAA